MIRTLTARLPKPIAAAAWWLALASIPLVVLLVARTVDGAALRAVGAAVAANPGSVVLVLAVYAGAFVLRGLAWTRTLPGLPLRQAVAALHVSLGANHVLPLRLGEVLRVTSVVRRVGTDPAAAVASTVTLRAADVAAIGALAAVLGPGLALDVLGGLGPLLLVVAVGLVVVGGRWSTRWAPGGVRAPDATSFGLVVASWLLEAVVIHQAAAWAGVELSAAQAVLVTAVTIAAQVVAVAPGGFGTYEAAATAVLVALGVPAATGLAVAVAAHALKTAYALATGAAAAVVPAPSLLGPLRLPAVDRGQIDPGSPPGPRDPVVLFLPAHDEQDTVGDVVGRVPVEVLGHPVRCLVIDDGSTDETAARAAAAGAEVVPMGRNAGLGAAVRRGLQEGVSRGAAVVAFCDADGEYAPEELARLAEPILSGRADYVVGSRFAGRIERMLPHRRLGNKVLTTALRFVTRTTISDGQSGYRALSQTAAAEAEVIHDFNYAQVLTIDLLARGARYAEVPISYRFRERGRSFVRLPSYLAAVVPAVHRQLRRDVPPLRHAQVASAPPRA